MQTKRIRIDFKVTEQIRRFAYLYVIVSKDIHLIDTGVAGAETVIEDYLKSIGRNISDVKNILLSHSHPDHIGSAFKIKECSNCTVYAAEAEKAWIENIDQQFAERPIPNFHTLLNQSVSVDKTLIDNDILVLEEGVTIQVIETRGHSAGSMSFLWMEQGELFTGDAIPAPKDIPIYVSAKDSIATLQKLLALNGVKRYLPAWDDVYDADQGKTVIRKSIDYLLRIDETVKNILTETGVDNNLDEIYRQVCAALNLQNPLPLFKASVFANIREAI
jgi:glyoxylase-like metal-dependent hydrolase (beta-lactamase superfamily II)